MADDNKNRVHAELMKLARAGEITYYYTKL